MLTNMLRILDIIIYIKLDIMDFTMAICVSNPLVSLPHGYSTV